MVSRIPEKGKELAANRKRIFVNDANKPLRFYLLASVPNRQSYQQQIEKHGGQIASTDKSNQVYIIDNPYKASRSVPRTAYSYHLLEQSLKDGRLCNFDDFAILPQMSASTGALALITKPTQGRNSYTKEDDEDMLKYFGNKDLWNYSGSTAFQQYAISHPNHTWQSYRERWRKVLCKQKKMHEKLSLQQPSLNNSNDKRTVPLEYAPTGDGNLAESQRRLHYSRYSDQLEIAPAMPEQFTTPTYRMSYPIGPSSEPINPYSESYRMSHPSDYFQYHSARQERIPPSIAAQQMSHLGPSSLRLQYTPRHSMDFPRASYDPYYQFRENPASDIVAGRRLNMDDETAFQQELRELKSVLHSSNFYSLFAQRHPSFSPNEWKTRFEESLANGLIERPTPSNLEQATSAEKPSTMKPSQTPESQNSEPLETEERQNSEPVETEDRQNLEPVEAGERQTVSKSNTPSAIESITTSKRFLSNDHSKSDSPAYTRTRQWHQNQAVSSPRLSNSSGRGESVTTPRRVTRSMQKVHKLDNRKIRRPLRVSSHIKNDSNTTYVLNRAKDEYIIESNDRKGESKITRDGKLLGDREYIVNVFHLHGKGNKLFMLGYEVAHLLNYYDSSTLFYYNRSLYAFLLHPQDRKDLITKGFIKHPTSFKIYCVAARSVFINFGHHVVLNGEPIQDDYFKSQFDNQEKSLESNYDKETSNSSQDPKSPNSKLKTDEAALSRHVIASKAISERRVSSPIRKHLTRSADPIQKNAALLVEKSLPQISTKTQNQVVVSEALYSSDESRRRTVADKEIEHKIHPPTTKPTRRFSSWQYLKHTLSSPFTNNAAVTKKQIAEQKKSISPLRHTDQPSKNSTKPSMPTVKGTPELSSPGGNSEYEDVQDIESNIVNQSTAKLDTHGNTEHTGEPDCSTENKLSRESLESISDSGDESLPVKQDTVNHTGLQNHGNSEEYQFKGFDFNFDLSFDIAELPKVELVAPHSSRKRVASRELTPEGNFEPENQPEEIASQSPKVGMKRQRSYRKFVIDSPSSQKEQIHNVEQSSVKDQELYEDGHLVSLTNDHQPLKRSRALPWTQKKADLSTHIVDRQKERIPSLPPSQLLPLSQSLDWVASKAHQYGLDEVKILEALYQANGSKNLAQLVLDAMQCGEVIRTPRVWSAKDDHIALYGTDEEKHRLNIFHQGTLQERLVFLDVWKWHKD